MRARCLSFFLSFLLEGIGEGVAALKVRLEAFEAILPKSSKGSIADFFGVEVALERENILGIKYQKNQESERRSAQRQEEKVEREMICSPSRRDAATGSPLPRAQFREAATKYSNLHSRIPHMVTHTFLLLDVEARLFPAQGPLEPIIQSKQ